MKKTLLVTFLIVGTIIGAGFASGREISHFFARYGIYSIFFLPVLFVLFYYLFKLLLSIGKEREFITIKELNSFANNSSFMNFSLGVIFIVFSSAMLSGTVELLNTAFPSVPIVFFYIICFAICLLVLRVGFNGLVRLNATLVPILILLIVSICIYGTFCPITNIAFIPENTKVYILPISIILYVFSNILLSYYLLVKAGSGLSKKTIKRASLLSASIITAVIFFCIICLIVNGSAIMNSEMPFVALSLRLGEACSIIFIITVLVGILTTLFSGLFTANELMGFKSKLKNVTTCSIVLILSLIGFKQIVDFAYPIFGIIGIIMVFKLVLSIKSFLKPRFYPGDNKIHPASKNTKN